MIQVFQKEIDDGLADKIRQDTSIAFVLDAGQIEDSVKAEFLKAIASTDIPKQIDLFYFESILVSTGWNKNDDIFDKAELWKAKATPINKKINYMHDEKDIVGHMVTSRSIDDNNRFINFDCPIEQLPNNFNILVGGVLYKIWETPELQARMDNIIADIGVGKWKVSMECIYPHFDYGIITPDGQQKIIPRNTETSFLSKYLRRYGGEGKFENYKVGRVLRDLIFSGKGIVDEPANPKSKITKTEYSEFLGTAASVNILTTEKDIMPDVTYTQAQYDELKVKLEKVEATAKDFAEKSFAKEKVDLQETIKKLETDKTSLATELTASKEVVKANESKTKTLETELAETNKKLVKANEDLAVVAKEALKAKRLAMFNDIDVEPAKAQELVEKFLGTDDSIFDELVKAMPKKKAEDKTKKDDKSEAADALAKAKDKDGAGSPPPPDDAAGAKAKVLESVKAWLVDSLTKNTKKGE